MASSKLPLTNTTIRTIVQENPMHERAECAKNGYVATVSFVDGNSAIVAANTVILTLPDAYKPVKQTEFVDTFGKKRVRININGDVTLVEATDTFVRGTATYLTNTFGGG